MRRRSIVLSANKIIIFNRYIEINMAKNNKKMSVMPLADRVLIKPEEAEAAKRPSGIYIPETAQKEKPERGTVVAVGEGKRNDNGQLIPLRVKIGDTVMFSKYGFDEIKIDEEDYFIVSESQILAVLK
jgi:chaperonin GroES